MSPEPANLPEHQLERAVTALVPFVQEWDLPLNPEELHEMAYAVLQHGVDAPASEDDYVEIDRAVREQIAEFREQIAELHRKAYGEGA